VISTDSMTADFGMALRGVTAARIIDDVRGVKSGGGDVKAAGDD
jgi:hypothetical protein